MTTASSPSPAPLRQLLWLLLLLAVVFGLFWLASSEVWEQWFHVEEVPAPPHD